MTTPTLDQWKRGLQIAEQIAVLEKELAGILGNHPVPAAKSASTSQKAGKSKMSPAARARIAAAQRERWAKIKGRKAPVASKAPATKKRTMSSEVRAKLAAAMKARWAAAKAGKAPAPTAKK